MPDEVVQALEKSIKGFVTPGCDCRCSSFVANYLDASDIDRIGNRLPMVLPQPEFIKSCGFENIGVMKDGSIIEVKI